MIVHINQGEFLICVAAGFFCAGYMSLRWWVEEGRKKGMKEGRMFRCSSFGRKIFVLRSGREGWESEGERGKTCTCGGMCSGERGMGCILL